MADCSHRTSGRYINCAQTSPNDREILGTLVLADEHNLTVKEIEV
jgi:hypothetical protein